MKIKKIYFDMDGVLADFDRGVREVCGMDPTPQGAKWRPGMDDHMWAKIRLIDHYYNKLELMPGAKMMVDTLYEKYGDRCEILTGIPKPNKGILTSGEDKINWVHRLLNPELKVNIVYREQKPDYCTGKDCILIDDLKSNIEAWKATGGSGVLHINAEDTLRQISELEEEL